MISILIRFPSSNKQIKSFNILKALSFVMLFSLFLSCNKDDHDEEIITDVDGNIYHTVVIGNQTWMLENLKTTKYNDGTEIPNVEENEEWELMNSGAYCNYDNLESNCELYGRLYNWYAVNTGKLAPKEWRVATDSDWKILTDFLGGLEVAGGEIKEVGTIHWDSPNIGATNSSGFTALPGGHRYFDGYFTVINRGAIWWTSTSEDEGNAWFRSTMHNIIHIRRDVYGYQSGFSVRCIKEN
jgi:uncharacterized protein (TIGR02145 family)